MATLVTGSGFIGSHIAKNLVDRGDKPILYDAAPRTDCISDIVEIDKIKLVRGDILDFPQLLEVVRKENVERIIHTAAMLNIPGRVDSPHIGVKVNIEGILNILEIARILHIRRVVFTSSAVVYLGSSRPNEETYKEDFPLMTISGRPLSLYSTTKLAGEFIGLNYVDAYGVDFVAVRYALAFGPWRCRHGGGALLIREIIEKPLRGETAVIEEDYTWSGHQEFVYIKDAAMGTVLACYAENPKNRVYNIGIGKTIEFKEPIEIVKKLIPNANIKVKEISKGISGLPYVSESKPLDITKAQEELGYVPKYDLEGGIRDYIEWVRRRL